MFTTKTNFLDNNEILFELLMNRYPIVTVTVCHGNLGWTTTGDLTFCDNNAVPLLGYRYGIAWSLDY